MKPLITLMSVLFLALLSSCDGEDEENTAADIQVTYKTLHKSKKVKVQSGDTISLSVIDECQLFVKYDDVYDSVEVSLDAENMTIERVDDYYLCLPQSAGVVSASLQATSDTQHPAYMVFYFDIHKTWDVYEVSQILYTVRVPDSEEVMNEILTELAASYLPSQYDELRLGYEDRRSGTFLIRRSQYTNALEYVSVVVEEGTFTVSSDNQYKLIGESGAEINFTLMAYDEDDTSKYILKQDLTEVFQQKYPQNQIEKVAIIV